MKCLEPPFQELVVINFGTFWVQSEKAKTKVFLRAFAQHSLNNPDSWLQIDLQDTNFTSHFDLWGSIVTLSIHSESPVGPDWATDTKYLQKTPLLSSFLEHMWTPKATTKGTCFDGFLRPSPERFLRASGLHFKSFSSSMFILFGYNFVESLINVYDFVKRETCVWIDKNHIQLNVEAIGIRAEFAKKCSGGSRLRYFCSAFSRCALERDLNTT